MYLLHQFRTVGRKRFQESLERPKVSPVEAFRGIRLEGLEVGDGERVGELILRGLLDEIPARAVQRREEGLQVPRLVRGGKHDDLVAAVKLLDPLEHLVSGEFLRDKLAVFGGAVQPEVEKEEVVLPALDLASRIRTQTVVVGHPLVHDILHGVEPGGRKDALDGLRPSLVGLVVDEEYPLHRGSWHGAVASDGLAGGCPLDAVHHVLVIELLLYVREVLVVLSGDLRPPYELVQATCSPLVRQRVVAALRTRNGYPVQEGSAERFGRKGLEVAHPPWNLGRGAEVHFLGKEYLAIRRLPDIRCQRQVRHEHDRAQASISELLPGEPDVHREVHAERGVQVDLHDKEVDLLDKVGHHPVMDLLLPHRRFSGHLEQIRPDVLGKGLPGPFTNDICSCHIG